jgi:hypothetical protein
VRRSLKLTLTALVAAAAVAVPVVAGLVATTPTRDDAFTIDRFDRQVNLEPDGQLRVVETIEVTFTEPRRGIFRDLELEGPAARSATASSASTAARRTTRGPG